MDIRFYLFERINILPCPREALIVQVVFELHFVFFTPSIEDAFQSVFFLLHLQSAIQTKKVVAH